ncbi:MAG: signal peptidase I [bacterium]
MPDNKNQRHHLLSTLTRYLRIIVLAVVLALFVKVCLVEAYRIPSESMESTLLVGDYLLADKFVFGMQVPLLNLRLPSIREPQVGDVVVFHHADQPEKNFIKRIIARGGDWVEIVDKQVMVNGQAIEESGYVQHEDSMIASGLLLRPRDNFGPLQIPADNYFLLGDNRDHSTDSRFWGCVPRSEIIGRAWLIHWSWRPDPEAPRVQAGKPLSFLSSLTYNIAHLPERVRWGRLLSVIR